jgi:hypothetical protein
MQTNNLITRTQEQETADKVQKSKAIVIQEDEKLPSAKRVCFFVFLLYCGEFYFRIIFFLWIIVAHVSRLIPHALFLLCRF